MVSLTDTKISPLSQVLLQRVISSKCNGLSEEIDFYSSDNVVTVILTSFAESILDKGEENVVNSFSEWREMLLFTVSGVSI